MKLRSIHAITLAFCLLLIATSGAFAEGRPPAPVVTAKVKLGQVAPQTEFIGTAYFTEKSDVAAEVDGKVLTVRVLEGQRVKKNDILVELSASLLGTRIANARALQAQAKADFELAKLDNQRTTTLYKSKTVAAGEYDSKRLAAEASEKQYAATTATLRELTIQREKKKIRAPYDGIILERKIFRGEWASTGSTVITMASDDEFDIIVNAPERAFAFVKKGLKLDVHANSVTLPGEVWAVVPSGNVATRTFPVKIRVKNSDKSLAQGMEARVSLPRGAEGKTLIIPRDAVISNRGQLVAWVVIEGKAVPMPIAVIGYRGLEAGVMSDTLKEGMDVVIKGNERLQPNQPVAAQ